MRRVVILGSTGSIGTQALDVIAANPDRFEVVGLAAGTQRATQLAAQAERFGVADTALGADDAERLVRSVEADVVLNGITGSVGLGPTLAALETGATLALANKESLIVGGELVKRAAGPGPDRPGRLRALGDRAGAAVGRRRARCAGSCSPHPAARSAGARASRCGTSRRARRSRIRPGTWASSSRPTRRPS